MTRILAPALLAALLAACAGPAPAPTRAPPAVPATAPPAPTSVPAATAAPVATATPVAAATPDTRPQIDAPAWFDQAVLYEIFPRSFEDSNGDGIGDLQGIERKLDYIQSLGATAIWLTPFYPATTYHGYDVGDYTTVNPQFGTLDDFKSLVRAMKRRNMRLIIDFVANHSSNAHPFFKDAFKNPASKYTSWYQFSDKANTTYQSFFGAANLPDWNMQNPEVRKYLIDAAQFWLDLGADGLRCDYALGVGETFWHELRAAVKARHPDAVILGEVWDASAPKLRDYFNNGFDALFDFPWYLTLSGTADRNGEGVLNSRQPAEFMLAPYRVTQRLYPRGAQLVRFANNHDTNRLASQAQGDARRMRMAAALTLLGPGTPMLYYGEEIGMRGVKGDGEPYYDELRREPMDWYAGEAGSGMTSWFKPANRNNKPGDGVSVEEEDKAADSLLNYYRALGKVRATHPALRGTDFQISVAPDCESCLTIWRWSGGEAVLLLFNLGDTAQTIAFSPADAPVRVAGEPQNVLNWSAAAGHTTIAPWGVAAAGFAAR